MVLCKLIQPRELFYPSNILTLARLGLLPVTLYYLAQPARRREALVCLGFTMFTDAIDGPIARARGEVSRLGEVLDPIADKLLLDSSAVILSRTRGFPWWVTVLLLFRDVGILLAALMVLRKRSRITTARRSGKATTAALTAAALLYIADGPRSGRPAVYLALVPFGISFFEYGKQFLKLMRHQETQH